MNLIELLILIILLKSTDVSSTKCRNPNVTCFELCCGMEQRYVEGLRWCKDPEFSQHLWLALIKNYMNTKEVDFIEFGECSLSPKQSVIEECFGPNYNYYEGVIEFVRYSNVPCDRLRPEPKDPFLIGTTLLDLSLICLPIMLLLLCIKKDKKNKLSYKLMSWYLTMSIATLLSLELGVYINSEIKSHESLLIYLNLLPPFFCSCTALWLSCIGVNVYIQFTETNDPHRERKDRLRFVWFSICVWGGALTLSIVDGMLHHWTNYRNLIDGPTYVPPFNVFAFLVLSFKISVIRCRVIGISTEKHIKCKLALTICRLGILMGIPRILVTILDKIIGPHPLYILLHLEPYMIYGTFILHNENFSTFFRCKSCCAASQNEENERTPEDIRMRNTSPV